MRAGLFLALAFAAVLAQPTSYPTPNAQLLTKQQQDFRAGMLAGWVPLAASLGALFWLFVAGRAGGKANGMGFWLQCLAVASMAIAWFFLLTPFWPVAVWMLVSGALIVFLASNPRLQYALIVLVLFNTVCYLGFNRSFWFTVNTTYNTQGSGGNVVDALLDSNIADQETQCVGYYGWYQGQEYDTNNPIGTGQCRNIMYKSWIIFSMIIQVVFIYPTMTLMAVMLVESNSVPSKSDARAQAQAPRADSQPLE